ncbi:helix-turn-helix transcriptional regulator [Geomonas propionica]|uniref:AlpA family phage regulatory protein n=1 Tax=Geomonas propionica TaxID=2798582 RepID=A0ABS0YN35_9BACT|nr:AlpA family phage regulatory protein [Geomonas propionica]MBJ6799326.1 AlpA family phage regulatory protein [Geomonas propionica]
MKTQVTDRLVRTKELKEITGMSTATIWRREREGNFPRRRKITSGMTAYLLSEVMDWMNNLKKADNKDKA